MLYRVLLFLFFFNDTATTEIYTLSLHDALPIAPTVHDPPPGPACEEGATPEPAALRPISESAINPKPIAIRRSGQNRCMGTQITSSRSSWKKTPRRKRTSPDAKWRARAGPSIRAR